jgi:hypothetical protein
MGELMCAYADENQHGLQMCSEVHFYDAVSYTVKDKADEEGKVLSAIEDYLVKVKVQVGDTIEFKAEDQPDGHRFGEVAAVMKHEDSAFLVVRWFLATGATHSKFGLPQFCRLTLFEDYQLGFFLISLVDEP